MTILLLFARLPLKWIAIIAIVPAIAAYAILLPAHSPEEEAFVRLQPPLINPGGIVNSGNGLYTIYALNIGDHPKVWLGDQEAQIVSHGPQNVTFRAGDASPDTPVSIESNGCRGNEFTLGWRP